MKHWGLAALLIVIGLAVYFGFSSRAKPGVNLTAPQFVLSDAKGLQVKSSEFGGRSMIVHFWASWCPPCTDELPELMEAAAAFSPDHLRFVFVSNDPDWTGALKLISKGKQSSSLIFLLDPDSHVADRFGTFQLPETYFVSKHGKILSKWIGPQKWKSDEAKKVLEELIQAEPKS